MMWFLNPERRGGRSERRPRLIGEEEEERDLQSSLKSPRSPKRRYCLLRIRTSLMTTACVDPCGRILKHSEFLPLEAPTQHQTSGRRARTNKTPRPRRPRRRRRNSQLVRASARRYLRYSRTSNLGTLLSQGPVGDVHMFADHRERMQHDAGIAADSSASARGMWLIGGDDDQRSLDVPLARAQSRVFARVPGGVLRRIAGIDASRRTQILRRREYLSRSAGRRGAVDAGDEETPRLSARQQIGHLRRAVGAAGQSDDALRLRQQPGLHALQRRHGGDEASATSADSAKPLRQTTESAAVRATRNPARSRIVASRRHGRPLPRAPGACCSIERKYSRAGLRCVLWRDACFARGGSIQLAQPVHDDHAGHPPVSSAIAADRIRITP